MKARIYRISETEILDIVKGAYLDCEMVEMVMVPVGRASLPDDAEVHHVWHDPDCRCFKVAVLSDTFDDIPCGEHLPIADDWMNLVYEAVKIEKSGKVEY